MAMIEMRKDKGTAAQNAAHVTIWGCVVMVVIFSTLWVVHPEWVKPAHERTQVEVSE